MATVTAQTSPVPAAPPSGTSRDHRGSPIPTGAMIATRFMELRKRRGLMIALILVNIGIPTIFLTVRLLAHAFDPKSYGPAGGYSIYTGLVAGVMYVFGFIVAATLGCTAGSVDLSEGMFRHLVVTGRSRLALYLADPRRVGNRRALGRSRIHHCLRGVRLRGSEDAELRRCECACRPFACRIRELGCQPFRLGHVRLRLQRTGFAERPLRT